MNGGIQKGGSSVGADVEANQRKAPHDAGNDMGPVKRLAAKHAPGSGGDSIGGNCGAAVAYLKRTKGGWSGGS